MTVVRLGKWEFLHAQTISSWRQTDNLTNGRSDAYGYRGNGWGLHIEGGIAEYAVAKHLNLFWSGVVSDPFVLPGDVGHVQVRSTCYPHGRLVVHPRDSDEDIFIHVIGNPAAREYKIMGWYVGGEAKRDEWWEDPQGSNRPAYWVPNAELCDIATIKGT